MPKIKDQIGPEKPYVKDPVTVDPYASDRKTGTSHPRVNGITFKNAPNGSLNTPDRHNSNDPNSSSKPNNGR